MDAILELSDETRLEVVLSALFNPEDNQVTVLVKNTEQTQLFVFDEICAVAMKGEIAKKYEAKTDFVEESITTSAGKTYDLHVLNNQSHSTGFFALSKKRDDPYRLVFSPFMGVKKRC